MNRLFRLAILTLGLAATGAAHASFHLWRTDQIYSNSDGKIQYIVVMAMASGQQYISNHNIVVTQGATSHTFTFNHDMPSDSAIVENGGGYYGGGTIVGYKSLLLATQGFANLNAVQPDFIIPDNFLFTSGGGSINWSNGWDIFNYTSIPMDGMNALFRAGNTASNMPTNFAGQSATISAVPAGPVNTQGLWWKSGGTESGWGINVTHQANTLFATWFTYDTDGSGMWLVLANGAQSSTNPNSYSGTLYRTTGPSFDSATWDSTKVVANPVGTGTFTFTDKDNGTFAYTVNGVTQTKTLGREVFGATVPTCVQFGSPSTSNYQDLWWHSPANSESGWGINITQQGSVIFATWFTYDSTGKGLWIVMAQGTSSTPGSYTGTLYTTTGPAFSSATFDPGQVHATPVGTGTFTFSDASNGTFTYTVNGVSGSKAITRESFATPSSVCN
jgi:hypothetical protein